MLSVVEVLAEPAVVSRLSDTKAAGEVKALDAFYTMLQNEPDRAFYGYLELFCCHSFHLYFFLLAYSQFHQ